MEFSGQILAYVPIRCPHCGCRSVATSSPLATRPTRFHRCRDCGLRWKSIELAFPTVGPITCPGLRAESTTVPVQTAVAYVPFRCPCCGCRHVVTSYPRPRGRRRYHRCRACLATWQTLEIDPVRVGCLRRAA